MNKRQRKKNQKKREMFIASWVSSYRKLRQEDRWYHEYMLKQERFERRIAEDLGFRDLQDYREWVVDNCGDPF